MIIMGLGLGTEPGMPLLGMGGVDRGMAMRSVIMGMVGRSTG